MELINGKEISLKIREELKKEIEGNNLTPGLAIIMVGDNPASEVYVRNKLKACAEIGIKAEKFHFPVTTSEEEIVDCVKRLNESDDINGIIVQSPVANGFNEAYINSFISPEKDVDGFGITNMGYLACNEEKYISATPHGIIKMLEYKNIPIEGANVVIVGRSKIVGRPLALALLNRNATVTITHSKTKDLKKITSQADILIVAIGKEHFITSDYVKDGAIVIDVGTNRGEDGKLHGDVDFERVKEKTSYITPVPGGVGPMTIAMLLYNVVENAKNKKDTVVRKLTK